MSTVKSVAATRSIRSRTRRIASLEPISAAAPSIDRFSDDGTFPLAARLRLASQCPLSLLAVMAESAPDSRLVRTLMVPSRVNCPHAEPLECSP